MFHLDGIKLNETVANTIPFLYDKKIITSGKDVKAALALREANAVPAFASISGAPPGFLKTFIAIFFDTLGPFLLKFLLKVTVTFGLYCIITNSHRFFSITYWTITN